MKLKSIKGQNFLSIGNKALEVNLDTFEKTFIVGENGTGKSVLIEMITFLLYGKPYRKLLKGEMVNTENGKKCVVEGEFESRGHTWKIIRGIKPDVLQLFKDDVEIDSTAAKDNFQEYIETYAIPFNYKSFKQVIALGTAGYKQFMDLTAPERREFVEEILDIGVFSVMNKINKEHIKTIKLEVSDLSRGREVVEHKMSTYKTVLDKSKADNKKQIDDLQAEADQLKGDIVNLKSDMDDAYERLEAKRSEYDASVRVRLREALTKINQSTGQYESERNTASRKIEFFDKSAQCPTCEQEISDEYKHKCKATLSDTVTSSTEKINKLKEKLKLANNKLENIDRLERQINELKNEYQSAKRDVEYAEQTLQSTEDKIVEAQKVSSSDTDGILESLRTLNKERKEYKEKEATLKAELHDRELLLGMLKDDGLKSVIVGNYLPIINSKVNEYLQIMGVNYGFTLDSTFKEKMTSRRQAKLSFNSLSQGQRMRVDLALMFTWRDVVQLRSGSRINTLILDEVMDSATDESGIKALRKIIDSLEDTNTTIISHNEKHNKDWFNRVIDVSFVGLFTNYNETINITTELSPYE